MYKVITDYNQPGGSPKPNEFIVDPDVFQRRLVMLNKRISTRNNIRSTISPALAVFASSKSKHVERLSITYAHVDVRAAYDVIAHNACLNDYLFESVRL